MYCPPASTIRWFPVTGREPSPLRERAPLLLLCGRAAGVTAGNCGYSLELQAARARLEARLFEVSPRAAHAGPAYRDATATDSANEPESVDQGRVGIHGGTD